MEYLQSLYKWPPEFWLGVALGSFVIVLFALSEFDRPTFEREEKHPETSFAPQELTTRRDYLMSFFIYVFGLEVVYLIVCILGPDTLLGVSGDQSGWTFESAASFPLWAALIYVGILPRFPGITLIEQLWRRLMHERASIPQAALSLSRELRRSDYELGRFRRIRESREDYAAFVAASDFDADPLSATYRWVRLSAILCELEFIERNSAAEEYVDFDFIERHRPELDAIRYRYRELAEKILRIRSPSAELASGFAEAPVSFRGDLALAGEADHHDSPPPRAVPDEFDAEIDDLLKRVCMFFACTLIAKSTSRRSISSAMRMFGFTSLIEIEPLSDIDVVLQGFFYAIFASFVFLFLATFLPQSIVQSGWPARGTDLFAWTFSVFLMHGTALFTSLLIRRHFRHQQRWLRGTTGALRMPKPTKYVGVIVGSYVLTLVVTLWWYNFYAGISWTDNFSILYQFAFVGSASGLFVCLILDYVDTHKSILRLWTTVALQTVVTSLIAWIANERFFTPSQSGAVDFGTIAAGLFALVLGVSTAALVKSSRRQAPSGEGAEEALGQA